jgi:hypothetical protein
MENIKELLASDPETVTWLAHLEAIGAPDFAVALPPAAELPAELLRLAVPHQDINDLVALLPTPERSAELWWVLERCAHTLVRSMGSVERPPPFPALPQRMGALRRYFYVYVFLAVLPQILAFHRRRDISDEVSRLTLADLGRNMAVHRRIYRVGGLDVAYWLMFHFRGVLYALGRLQFERARLGNRTGRAIAAAGLPYGPGDPVLAVHIPEFFGPLSPPACDASFQHATRFFARHFPEERYDLATCHSWLLDDQLALYLPADANIIRFQRRFRPAYRSDDDDGPIMRFVFGCVQPDLQGLTPHTTLERAIVDHLQAGRHWRSGAGWLRL